jgi:probable phosphoglycerate mutase
MSSPVVRKDDPEETDEPSELKFEPGELAPHAASPFPNAELSEKAKNELKYLCDLASKKDLAARRWEVNQAWEARLFSRGYQYLWPRKNGGWLIPPASTPNTAGQRAISGFPSYGRETNIVGLYGEILTAALTRDIPNVRFQPANPKSDADITAANAAEKYKELFKRSNDLLDFQQQLAYFFCTDGRVTILTDHVIDAQRFGRDEEIEENPVVPETERSSETQYLVYLVRHGETKLNEEDKLRGRSDVSLDHVGQREADRAGDWLKDKGIKKIISSPVPRAADSANALSQTTGVPVDFDDRFSSLDLGDMAEEDRDAAHDKISEYFEKGNEAFPNGESPDDFKKRVAEGLMDAMRSETPVAIVTHDSVISQIFKMFQGDELPAAQMVEPGGVAGMNIGEDGAPSIQSVFPYQRPESSSSKTRSQPRGEETVSVYGKLESKVPINAQNVHECDFVQISREFDVSFLKAKYPEIADKIQPGPSGAGELELDRIARINSMIALEASYVTGDSLTLDATEQKTWLRPSWFMHSKNDDTKQELLENFPDGCLVVFAGQTLALARNESMDDHIFVTNCFPGSGMNRMALCSKLMAVQRKLNNWMELLDLYFRATVPIKHINAKVYDVEAIRNQPNVPGGFIPFTIDALPPQHTQQDMIFIEPTPTHQPSMPDFIKFFIMDLPQMISHALPSLFGADSNQDTASGQAMQRDAALEAMGTPWHAIQEATSAYFRQAVQLAARCRNKPIIGSTRTGETVQLELTELKGNVLCYPENDANFPESWHQKQARYQMMIMDAATNPVMLKMLSTPGNLKLAQEMAGITELEIPEADSYEKQEGEIEELLKTGPIPNPEKQQIQAEFEKLTQQAQALMAAGMPLAPDEETQLQSLQQQLQSMPDNISTVPVDEEMDRHEVEYQAVQDFMNTPTGRRLKNGTPEEKLGIENVRLHGLEHKAKIPKPDIPMKPPSTSIAFKDLPPEAAAAVLQKQGLPSDAEKVAQGKQFDAALKHFPKLVPPQ